MSALVLKAPFPYFGGKRKAAAEIWRRFGAVSNYVEPFFGSGACLLGRPNPFSGNETVNDADGLLANFWRALTADPEHTAHHADWPVSENDLHARHVWLVGQKDALQERLEGDPDFFDPKIAGWWAWGMSCWIGSGFCSGNGPWRRMQNEDGEWILANGGNNGRGVNRKLVHLGDNGRGVNRKTEGVEKKRPVLAGSAGGKVCLGSRPDLLEYFRALAERLRSVRVCCGDWSRVCGPSVTFKHGLTGVFLDPPYADTAKRSKNLYVKDCESVAHDVCRWAVENGGNPLLKIALAGYQGEHEMPANWGVYEWNAGEGFGGQADKRTNNGKRERIWFSPNCSQPEQTSFL